VPCTAAWRLIMISLPSGGGPVSERTARTAAFLMFRPEYLLGEIGGNFLI
jgi:hypothetical protein